jgi:hypothetical protein
MTATNTPRKSGVVFISYRRRDTDALAGRLFDRMGQALPDWTFFMDVTSIEPGEDFRVAIDKAMKQSSLFLMLIGRNWLGDGVNRLLRPGDSVAYEIETAIHLGLRLIPVLVNDTKMPSPEDFPEKIRSAASRNAVELRLSRFDDDFRNLVSVIRGEPKPKARPSGEKPRLRTIGGNIGAIVLGAVIGIALGLTILVISFHATGRSASDWIGDDGAALLLPTVGILGAAAGLLFSLRNSRRLDH